MQEEEWKIPNNTFVHQNPLKLPNMEVLNIKLAGMRTSTIKELVFFGRLETRKGVALFCDAVERVLSRRDLKVGMVCCLSFFNFLLGHFFGKERQNI